MVQRKSFRICRHWSAINSQNQQMCGKVTEIASPTTKKRSHVVSGNKCGWRAPKNSTSVDDHFTCRILFSNFALILALASFSTPCRRHRCIICRMTYFADSVLPAPLSPLTMQHWFLRCASIPWYLQEKASLITPKIQPVNKLWRVAYKEKYMRQLSARKHTLDFSTNCACKRANCITHAESAIAKTCGAFWLLVCRSYTSCTCVKHKQRISDLKYHSYSEAKCVRDSVRII